MGGLTADEALSKLENTTFKNNVYVGGRLFYDGKDTKTGFSAKDASSVRAVLRKQRSWFPSSKQADLTLYPNRANQYRQEALRQTVSEKLQKTNRTRQAPIDAQAYLKNKQLAVSPSRKGEKYDIKAMMKVYDRHPYRSEIHLKSVYLQPIKKDSSIVRDEKARLKALLHQTVRYKVQSKVYDLKAADLIKNATVTKEMTLDIDTKELKQKIDAINRAQSTLNKAYSFKKHDGAVISVKGKSYGWAIDVDKEAKYIADAFKKQKKSIDALNVYGVGYSTYGIGYHVESNGGIGTTYAEVSIEDQRIWIYKNGRLVLTTHVVTGRHDTREDTPKGLWYIEYKQSPSVLEGSEAGNSHYKVKVSYWAPFTLSGCGFHDAGWRKNWSKTAYLKNGSGGCVNTPPTVMKTVYNHLEQNEPVVIY